MVKVVHVFSLKLLLVKSNQLVTIFYTCLVGGESSSPSRHGKVGRTAKQYLAIQDNPQAAEEETHNILIATLVI
jgi:hypothetical protein